MTKIKIGGELYSAETQHKVVDTEQIKDITRDNLSQTEINDDIETNATYSEDGEYVLLDMFKIINSYTKEESNLLFATKDVIKNINLILKNLDNRIRILESKHDITSEELISFNKSFNKSFK